MPFKQKITKLIHLEQKEKAVLSLQKVDYHIAGRHLLQGVTFQISDKQHIGLVGRNGSGKTTLFKILLTKLLPDAGKVDIAKHLKILSIQQDIPSGEISALEYLLNQDAERLNLLKKVDTCEDPNELGDIYDRLIAIDAYTAEARAATVLKGLGFNDDQQLMPLNTFSGGYRMRIALAAILYQTPDILLLDEPTNHLDLETTQWLENFLKTYPKSFLLISHDRNFLNQTVDHIFHLKQGSIKTYKGNFDTFLKNYTIQQANISSQNTKLEEKRKHMLSFVNRFKAKASKAKQAQSRLKAIAKINFIPVDQDDPTICFNFPEPSEMPPPLISFHKASVGYEGNIILKNLSGSIAPHDRIALVGANGNGKTTFARFLATHLEALKGDITFNKKLKTAFYQQDQLNDLCLQESPFDHISKRLGHSRETEIRTHLGRFGFAKEKANQPVQTLSGGERARLLFACLTTDKPNLLILDEPTNHLDIEMRESLISALNQFDGAVILITHDRYLLEHVADELWVVRDGSVTAFDGTTNDYYKSLK